MQHPVLTDEQVLTAGRLMRFGVRNPDRAERIKVALYVSAVETLALAEADDASP
jgi:hypothetical protein